MKGNLINGSCFLKFTISGRRGHCDYSSPGRLNAYATTLERCEKGTLKSQGQTLHGTPGGE